MPFGRFKYLRGPYGICSISEHYDRSMAEAFAGLTGFRRVVDDIIIYDEDEIEHTAHVQQFLKRCLDKQIALNSDKCKFSQTSVTFAGFTLSAKGYQVDHSITDAITDFHWGISKCKLFLSGLQHFTVITDHNPLIPILNNHRLDEIENPRLQRLKTRLMAYNFTALWLKGINNNAPDAHSRHPVCNPQPADNLAERDAYNNPEMSFTELRDIGDAQYGVSESLHLQELRKHAQQDEEYQLLHTFILNGFHKQRKQLPESCRR